MTTLNRRKCTMFIVVHWVYINFLLMFISVLLISINVHGCCFQKTDVYLVKWMMFNSRKWENIHRTSVAHRSHIGRTSVAHPSHIHRTSVAHPSHIQSMCTSNVCGDITMSYSTVKTVCDFVTRPPQ